MEADVLVPLAHSDAGAISEHGAAPGGARGASSDTEKLLIAGKRSVRSARRTGTGSPLVVGDGEIVS